MEVNWKEVTSGGYVQIEEGVPKTLRLKNWKPQTQFKDEKTGELRPGVVFEVFKDDNTEYDETTKTEYTVTAKGALKQFQPICEKAEAAGSKDITVTIVAVGKGTARTYSIKEVA